jgi:photosystem II stability/assembly factor-like uncharacterized protein
MIYDRGITFTDICFFDENHGWMVGWDENRGGTIVKTDDGGNTWPNENIEFFDGIFYGIYFTDENHGWAVGDDGIMKYKNSQ